MAQLIHTYSRQARYKDAENVLLDWIGIQTQRWGPGYETVLSAAGSLVDIYRQQGRLEDAKELKRSVIEMRRQTTGSEYPESTRTLHKMEQLSAANYDEAWILREIEKHETAVGPSHRVTLVEMGDLASLYRELGRLDEAEKLLIQVVAGLTAALGPTDEFTLNHQCQLGTVYLPGTRAISRGGKLFLEVLRASYDALGPEDLRTSMALCALAVLRMGTDTSDQFLSKYIDHPIISIGAQLLAQFWKCQSRDREAVKLLQECLRVQMATFGPAHPATVNTAELFELRRILENERW
ncbi:hypothetical protein BJY01DRAFT_254757 [Aspergillus pseudoustus]|uniref:Tetratricopeptide repeat-domain-containing protein n=1 Tax=Aspergillus pseudoustus TaxID=1810923 RepID=A0ABR4ITF5_9EURO